MIISFQILFNPIIAKLIAYASHVKKMITGDVWLPPRIIHGSGSATVAMKVLIKYDYSYRCISQHQTYDVKYKLSPGFEPGSVDSKSTVITNYTKRAKLRPGFEPRSVDSESTVITNYTNGAKIRKIMVSSMDGNRTQ